jgi:hypothetical protein
MSLDKQQLLRRQGQFLSPAFQSVKYILLETCVNFRQNRNQSIRGAISPDSAFEKLILCALLCRLTRQFP